MLANDSAAKEDVFRGAADSATLRDSTGGKDDAKNAGDDVSDGPLKGRGCTDVWCLAIFLAFLAGFVVVVLAGMKDGTPAKLYSPRDYKGDYCGIDTQWNSGTNLEKHEKLIHMMNLTVMIDEPAKTFVCSKAAEDALRGVLTVEAMDKYMCACCKTPCKSCEGVLALDDFSTPAAAAGSTKNKLADLTDKSRMNDLFSPTGANGGKFNNMLSAATAYFYQVCVPNCNAAAYDGEDFRSYTYQPSPDAPWRDAWETLRTNQAVDAVMRNMLASSFNFKALPLAMCPYQAKYCVPFPGMGFEEVIAGYCSFKASSEMLEAMGASAMGPAIEMSEKGFETLGSAMGDVLETIDAFAVVSVLAFVFGIVFLISLRFAIGYVVWGSLFGVFVLFMGSGAAAYVRSGQCRGTSFSDTGTNYGISAATVATNKVNGVVVTSDESISGVGADYRGTQTRTRGARKCQAWNVTTPHSQSVYATHSDAKYGLVGNYCRNPIDSVYIWCYTTDPEVRWELCDPIGVQPWQHQCPNGFVVAGETQRKVLEVAAYVLWGCSLLWWLIVCCLFSRIRLAVALNKVAATFLYHTPQVFFVPIVQSIFCILWTVAWTFLAAFILSQVSEDYVPKDSYSSWAIAAGTEDVPGKCNDKWPTGFAWKYEGDVTSKTDTCSGNLGDTTDITPLCWRCTVPRYMMDVRFAYAFFAYLWVNMFLIAVGQTTIAGACGVWFFAPNGHKHNQNAVQTGLRNVWRYHAGSLALGSFIIAAVQFIRYCLKYLEMQARTQKNKVMVIVLKVVGYLVWCFEKCLKFLTKNAYIQIALTGNNFCTSAKKAFYLIMRNGVRFGVFAMLGGVINWLGNFVIVASTLFIGYYILMAMHPDITPLVPMIVFLMMSWTVAKLFMMVFHLSCDTMMQCFILTEEMGLERAKSFVPGELRSLIPSTE